MMGPRDLRVWQVHKASRVPKVQPVWRVPLDLSVTLVHKVHPDLKEPSGPLEFRDRKV